MGIDIMPMVILGGAGLIAAVVLYFIAKKFAVHEDERIGQVEAILPGANCGACGRKGCHDFAVACCAAENLDGLFCPGAGAEGMKQIAELLGFEMAAAEAKKAFLVCNGTKCNRIVKLNGSFAPSCKLAKTMAVPENYCIWGCLGCGDCVKACRFGAMEMDAETGMPKVDLEKCVGCEACMKACPQQIIVMRTPSESRPTVLVRCSNKAKGAQARKMCTVACIGCGKCVRICPEKAITLTNNLAAIDPSLCIGCGKCVEGCPTKAIRFVYPTAESEAEQSITEKTTQEQ